MESERIWILLAKKKNGEATADELFELEKLMVAENKGYSNELMEKICQAPLHSLPEMKLSEAAWQTVSDKINKPAFKVTFLYKKIGGGCDNNWSYSGFYLFFLEPRYSTGLFFIPKG